MKEFLLLTITLLSCALPHSLMAQLDPTETDHLLWMREEEKLARDTYLTLHDTWGLNVFSNIARSEQRHMDALRTQLDLFGLQDPVLDDSIGVFNDATLSGLYLDLTGRGAVSSLEALQVGAYIEELDIADLWEAIDQTDEPSLISTYENLLSGSRNHLRSFVSQIASTGTAYEAQYLTQEQVEAIVGGYELPQTDFEINAGLNDAWFYPATRGQGFFITVYPDSRTVFLSWFTFDTALHDEPLSGQRWFTAQGNYEGDQADLQVHVTSGGLFDSESPLPETLPEGSMVLRFEDCSHGTVSYDLPTFGRAGLVPIERVAPDNIAHCESLAKKATMD